MSFFTSGYTRQFIFSLYLKVQIWGLSLQSVSENGNSLSVQWSQFLPLPHSPLNVRCWAGIESLNHNCSAAASFYRSRLLLLQEAECLNPFSFPQQSFRTAATEMDGWNGETTVARLIGSHGWGFLWTGILDWFCSSGSHGLPGQASSHTGFKHCWMLPAWYVSVWFSARGGPISKTEELCLMFYKCQECSSFSNFLRFSCANPSILEESKWICQDYSSGSTR